MERRLKRGKFCHYEKGKLKDKKSAQQNLLYTPSVNVASYFSSYQRDIKFNYQWYNIAENIVCQRFKNYHVFQTFQSFERRVTTLLWHPSKNLILAGSKGGEMCMYSLKGVEVEENNFCYGVGPGGSILSCHFPAHTENSMLIASLDGTVRAWDITRLHSDPKTIMCTNEFERWYCSVSSSPETKLTLVGESNGFISVIDKDLKIVTKTKCHKNKVNTIDFNNNGWLFATASVDHTMKLFDIRKLMTNNKKASPVETKAHLKGVNAAYFNPKSSSRILTTDQDSELRVYKGPTWCIERTIQHPHRQFQHLTPIKASWHPICDLIIVGRYPDPKLPDYAQNSIRTIDIFSADSGNLKTQVYSSYSSGITSLVTFDPTGEFIASGMSRYIQFWHFPISFEKTREKENLNKENERTELKSSKLKRKLKIST